MKKRIVALLLGGMLAAGSLAMQTPVTAWAITREDCGFGSESHIKNSTITVGDGQLTVAVDLEFESTHNPEARIYLLEKELDKKTVSEYDSTMAYPVLEEYNAEGSRENMCTSLSKSGQYTFTGLTGGKTYYAYAIVSDLHDMEVGEDSGEHYAAYLGSGTPTADSHTPSDNESSGITKEDCGFRSEPHIKNSSIAAGDGQFTVTVDIIYENQSSSGVEIFMFDRELNKDTLNDIDPESGLNYVWKELRDELAEEGNNDWQIDNESRRKFIRLGGSYTFTGLENGKTRYLYAAVADWHDDSADEATHSYVYLGSVTPGSGGDNSSDNSSSDSSSSNSGSGDSSSVTPPRDYAKEAEERVLNQIQSAPAGSTVVMDRSITTLSNAAMKELLKQGDVSLKLDFTYLGQRYVITIPAGEALNDDVPWYGPLYLEQQFGNSASVNEVNARGTERELIAQIKETPADLVPTPIPAAVITDADSVKAVAVEVLKDKWGVGA